MQPRFLAEQEVVRFVLIAQSHTLSMHLEYGSATLHCRSVTHASPKLTAAKPSSFRTRMPVVVGGNAENIGNL